MDTHVQTWQATAGGSAGSAGGGRAVLAWHDVAVKMPVLLHWHVSFTLALASAAAARRTATRNILQA
jgi:hypothetical protein